MPRKSFWIAASCILALLGLLPVLSSGASPASKEKVIYSFAGGADGANPLSALALDSAGNLYGTTSQGGSKGRGTVFELKRTSDGWKEEVLYSFTGGSDGGNPEAGVIFDPAGNLYGTTGLGGTGCQSTGCGTVFELKHNKDGWKEEVLYDFTGGNDGDFPTADLILDSAGNLYGTTSSGGKGDRGQCNSEGCGAVFELTPHENGSWEERTLHTFRGAPDGGIPVHGVIFDSAGNAYGVTETGGSGLCGGKYYFFQGCGIVYKLTPNSGGNWTEAAIYSFHRGAGGGFYPSGGLLLDTSGHLLGTTWNGGNGLGTVFDLSNSQKGWLQLNPHVFYGNPDGIRPTGRLVADPKGNLFGVTTAGTGGRSYCGGRGNKSCGVVFELEPAGNNLWTERILHTFATTGGDGTDPEAGLVFGIGGHLYGTTQYGGSGTCDSGCGTVYEVTR
jgi:uncharacterized repeat protein (TIGR03803 family)